MVSNSNCSFHDFLVLTHNIALHFFTEPPNIMGEPAAKKAGVAFGVDVELQRPCTPSGGRLPSRLKSLQKQEPRAVTPAMLTDKQMKAAERRKVGSLRIEFQLHW